jgi:tetratricopeptide (TPR) repeat protein
MGGLKEYLYKYINQHYVNMFNRYQVTVEDEFIKKVRDFVDREESKTLNRYTPKEITEILDKIGGADKFHTGEIEKSIVNMYGHLQGHIQRGVTDLEVETNSILRQKTDVGAFVRGENAYSILKCIFKDNNLRKKHVYDVKLSINILDSELISPMYHYQTTVEKLMKDAIQKHIQDLIDHQVESFNDELVDQGKRDLGASEKMFEKIKRIENFTDDEKEDEKSKRYTILAKKFLDKIEGLRAEIDEEERDPLNLRDNIKYIIDEENIRNRGYNTCVNSLTSILDTSKLGYQVCDNLKNARICHIREYESRDVVELPDERYAMRLAYYDGNQLREEKKEFDKQMRSFTIAIQEIWDITHAYYESKKRFRSLKDLDDLYNRIMSKEWKAEKRARDADPDSVPWNEVGEMYIENTFVEKNNRTYEDRIKNLQGKIKYLRDILEKMHKYQNPVERVIIDERLNFLETKFNAFTYLVNPHHIQPGVVLDIDITTIKRKQYMLKGMANVLNEFLYGVSKGFADAAFASYSRRRSTVRADIDQAFGEESAEEEFFDMAYKDSGGTGVSDEVKGSVSLSPSKSKGKKRSGLKEL